MNYKVGDLYDPIFKKMDARQLQDNLQSIAHSIIEEDYTKQLTDEDLRNKKTELAEVSILISQIENRRKEAQKEFKAQLVKPRQEHGTLLESIKHQSDRVFGKLFLIDDQEENMMYYFDETGKCVKSRSLLPQEKQTVLKTIKTGTNE